MCRVRESMCLACVCLCVSWSVAECRLVPVRASSCVVWPACLCLSSRRRPVGSRVVIGQQSSGSLLHARQATHRHIARERRTRTVLARSLACSRRRPAHHTRLHPDTGIMSASSPPPPRECSPEYDVFEFFSGLGGFHLSLPAALRVHHITAVEIDKRAGEAYRHNLHARDERSDAHADVPADAATSGACAAAAVAGSTAAAATAAPAAVALSARAKMKANQIKLRQKQKEAADAKRAAEAATATTEATMDAAAAPAATATAAAEATSEACAQSATEPAEQSIHSLPISAFSFPPPSLDRSDVIHPAAPPVLLTRLIEQLPASTFVSPTGRPTMWLMSPPCQPFTRTKGAKRLCGADRRNAAFTSLLAALRSLPHDARPELLALENVKHFLYSDMHAALLDAMRACGYRVTQYLLSPHQIGVPNHRTRFYLVAEKMTQAEADAREERQWEEERLHVQMMPPNADDLKREWADRRSEDAAESSCGDTDDEDDARADDDQEEDEEVGNDDNDPTQDSGAAASLSPSSSSGVPSDAAAAVVPPPSSLPVVVPPRRLQSYLDPPSFQSDALLSALTLPASSLRHPHRLSVVSPHDRRTFCFTGGYGQVMHTSSGSLLLTRGSQIDRRQSITRHPLDRSAGWSAHIGSLRFFSPMELLRLFGFPDWYRMPDHFTCRHAFKLVGNSINVGVVRSILDHHITKMHRR